MAPPGHCKTVRDTWQPAPGLRTSIVTRQGPARNRKRASRLGLSPSHTRLFESEPAALRAGFQSGGGRRRLDMGHGASLGNKGAERWPDSRVVTSATAAYPDRWSRTGPFGPRTHSGILIPWWFRLVQIFRNRPGRRPLFLCLISIAKLDCIKTYDNLSRRGAAQPVVLYWLVTAGLLKTVCMRSVLRFQDQIRHVVQNCPIPQQRS